MFSGYDCHFGSQAGPFFTKGMTPMKESRASEKKSERTSAQEKSFRRLLQDIAEHAATVALGKIKADRKGWQRAIESGDELREGVTDKVISMVGEVSASRLRYVNSVPMSASEDVVLTEQLLREKYNVGWRGDNFARLFLGKTLKGAPAGMVAVNQLKEYSTNQQLKDELGNEAVTPFASMLSLVEKQRNGETGSLLVNGWANLVLVEVEGELWVVLVYWYFYCRCWGVGAYPLENPRRWRDGYQILSCDS